MFKEGIGDEEEELTEIDESLDNSKSLSGVSEQKVSPVDIEEGFERIIGSGDYQRAEKYWMDQINSQDWSEGDVYSGESVDLDQQGKDQNNSDNPYEERSVAGEKVEVVVNLEELKDRDYEVAVITKEGADGFSDFQEQETRKRNINSYIALKKTDTEGMVENLGSNKKGLFKRLIEISKNKKTQVVIGAAILGLSLAVPPVGGAAFLTGGAISGFLPVGLGIPLKVLGGATGGFLLRKIIERRKSSVQEIEFEMMPELEDDEMEQAEVESDVKNDQGMVDGIEGSEVEVGEQSHVKEVSMEGGEGDDKEIQPPIGEQSEPLDNKEEIEVANILEKDYEEKADSIDREREIKEQKGLESNDKKVIKIWKESLAQRDFTPEKRNLFDLCKEYSELPERFNTEGKDDQMDIIRFLVQQEQIKSLGKWQGSYGMSYDSMKKVIRLNDYGAPESFYDSMVVKGSEYCPKYEEERIYRFRHEASHAMSSFMTRQLIDSLYMNMGKADLVSSVSDNDKENNIWRIAKIMSKGGGRESFTSPLIDLMNFLYEKREKEPRNGVTLLGNQQFYDNIFSDENSKHYIADPIFRDEVERRVRVWEDVAEIVNIYLWSKDYYNSYLDSLVSGKGTERGLVTITEEEKKKLDDMIGRYLEMFSESISSLQDPESLQSKEGQSEIEDEVVQAAPEEEPRSLGNYEKKGIVNWKEVNRSQEIVTIGDSYGSLEYLKANLKKADLIENDEDGNPRWKGGDKKVIIHGDILGDRKPHGMDALRFIKKLSNQAEEEGGSIEVLAGNHDDFLISYLLGVYGAGFSDVVGSCKMGRYYGLLELCQFGSDEMKKIDLDNFDRLPNDKKNSIWEELENGRDQILENMRNSPEGREILELICNLKLVIKQDDSLFTHTDPTELMMKTIMQNGNPDATIDSINDYYQKGLRSVLLGEEEDSRKDAKKIFDGVRNVFLDTNNRDYFFEGKSEEEKTDMINEVRSQGINLMIHGHSPIRNFEEKEDGNGLIIRSNDSSWGRRNSRSIISIKKDGKVEVVDMKRFLIRGDESQ